jgi:hypothetical protein
VVRIDPLAGSLLSLDLPGLFAPEIAHLLGSGQRA